LISRKSGLGKGKGRGSPVPGSRKWELPFLGGAGGTDFAAGAAVVTFGGVNDVLVHPLADCLLRTFRYASSAVDAIIGNRMSHKISPHPLVDIFQSSAEPENALKRTMIFY
jgi:hypothetical protein